MLGHKNLCEAILHIQNFRTERLYHLIPSVLKLEKTRSKLLGIPKSIQQFIITVIWET